MIEPWVLAKLITDGVITPSGLGRKARAMPCRRCGLLILTGLDDDVCAFVVRADPEPVNATGEFWAIFDGRATFDLSPRSGGWQIDARPAHRVRATDFRRARVVAEHRCHAPVTLAPWAGCGVISRTNAGRVDRETQDMINRLEMAARQAEPPF